MNSRVIVLRSVHQEYLLCIKHAVYSLPVIVILMVAVLPKSFGQGFLHTSGKAITSESGDTVLLRGMGLGGWMLQEGYMLQTAGFANAQHQIRKRIRDLIGTEETDLFYEAWQDNHVRKIDIDSLKSWGFNSVRLPMHYNLFTLPIEEEPIVGQNTWLTRGFELTDSLLSWCKQNEMYVILDLHAAPGGQGRDEGISDYDPQKPSLWESQENKDKTVALWKRIAKYYKDEPWIAGYDLINEPNWPLEGNIALRDLYYSLTDSIRSVDTNHILFIEGNWFANDFTALTPPWDDNLVYSPHKYWSVNDQASIQWVLDIREEYDVPIYFGECGENSNRWFRDAIRLFDEFNLGWAWWPMKKIESISGPLSIVKTNGYQRLLDFWNGDGPRPSADEAKSILMELTEKLKVEHCIFQKDVIDAMFRQVRSEESKPFVTRQIPGVIYASDFDLGQVGSAYFDYEDANYQVSTGNFTAWNNGWVYRNDGVDIEPSMDNFNTNGYNVGWVEAGEWMQYDIDVIRDGVYDVAVRTAANTSAGRFHLALPEGELSTIANVPGSGGWQNWQTVLVKDVILTREDQKIQFIADAAGFNLGSFQFVYKDSTQTIPLVPLSARTQNERSIVVFLNKPLGDVNSDPSLFQVLVNGQAIEIVETGGSLSSERALFIRLDQPLRAGDQIRISYTGNSILGNDGTLLQTFNNLAVSNSLLEAFIIPGRIEAEQYITHAGIQLENTSDMGGGQNIGYLDAGDFAEYQIRVLEEGMYNLDIRTAALSETGAIEIHLIDENDVAMIVGKYDFPPTGDWQSWNTSSFTVYLPEGNFVMRVLITAPLFNINWFDFSILTDTKDQIGRSDLKLYPNPSSGILYLEGLLPDQQAYHYYIYDQKGQNIFHQVLKGIGEVNESIRIDQFGEGVYYFLLRGENGKKFVRKFIVVSR